ncbi:MAG: hypothetical protein AAF393_03940 [Pseudomonadota bacterium]
MAVLILVFGGGFVIFCALVLFFKRLELRARNTRTISCSTQKKRSVDKAAPALGDAPDLVLKWPASQFFKVGVMGVAFIAFGVFLCSLDFYNIVSVPEKLIILAFILILLGAGTPIYLLAKWRKRIIMRNAQLQSRGLLLRSRWLPLDGLTALQPDKTGLQAGLTLMFGRRQLYVDGRHGNYREFLSQLADRGLNLQPR